jgi:hypothetical protein
MGGGVTAATPPRAERKVLTMHREQRTAAWLLGLVLTVSGLACSSSQKVETTTGSAPAPERACFNVRNVDSFSPLSNRFVYVRTTGDKHYLLTMDAMYPSLPYATGIAMSGNYAWVFSNTGAMITYVDAGRPVFCRILSVEAVDSKAVAQQVVKDRTTPEPKPKG